MKAVIQRVKSASVSVDGEVKGEIGQGLLVLLGVGQEDSRSDIDYLVRKIVGMRIFPRQGGIKEKEKFDLSLKDVGGEMLVVSQFTLFANTKKGNRPGFTDAARPEEANKLYEEFCEVVEAEGIKVEKGVFAAMMDVELVNDGPVTINLDSKEK